MTPRLPRSKRESFYFFPRSLCSWQSVLHVSLSQQCRFRFPPNLHRTWLSWLPPESGAYRHPASAQCRLFFQIYDSDATLSVWLGARRADRDEVSPLKRKTSENKITVLFSLGVPVSFDVGSINVDDCTSYGRRLTILSNQFYIAPKRRALG